MLHDQSQRSCEQYSAKSLRISAYFREEILLLRPRELVTGCPTSRLPGTRRNPKQQQSYLTWSLFLFSGYNSLQIERCHSNDNLADDENDSTMFNPSTKVSKPHRLESYSPSALTTIAATFLSRFHATVFTNQPSSQNARRMVDK